ncbi:MAG: ribosome-associated translation inhibitor RaiA [Bacillota bacterium]|jgi:putative sigma-54 modulation protein|nr:ribosome-associated translation inhibitor RaiA [Bacillota bacterium]NLV62419.1 ribosome-associated translation inhibitor RaiA [Clostridiaceae bacterium]
MKYIFSGKNINLSSSLKQHATKKLNKIEKFFKPETECHLTFSVEKNRNIFEVTILSKGLFIRAEETTNDMYASIDAVIDKLERQIRKNKTKLGRRIHQEAFVPDNFQIDEQIEEENSFKIMKSKRFAIKPMDVEEAILQMNLLGHNFFVFSNSETEEVNVVYKRKDGNYGLIEPEF